jgi:hypothetical protein
LLSWVFSNYIKISQKLTKEFKGNHQIQLQKKLY